MTRWFLTSVVTVGSLALVFAGEAMATPTPSFTVAPDPIVAGQEATFTSTSTGVGALINVWDFGDGTATQTGTEVRHTFDSAGTYNGTLEVTDEDPDNPTATIPLTIVVQEPPPPIPPVAGLSVSPSTPTAGVAARFTSNSLPVSAEFPITSFAWFVDGSPAGNGQTVPHTFTSAGNHTVRLEVVDVRGVGAQAELRVYVNARPVAGFNVFPDSPLVGETVNLTSTSSDREGEPLQQWDLDGDGVHDDGQGRSVKGVFRVAGTHTVSLRVTDGQGIPDRAWVRIRVRPSPMLQPIPNQPRSGNSAPTIAQQPFLRLITPFPVVRLQGAVVKRGTRIRRLTVRTPKGSRVLVVCRGRRCPTKKRLTKVAGRGTLRFRKLERLVPAGSLVQVFVRRGDRIGKYTSFRIRRKRVPKRIDGCLLPSSPRAVTCPQE